MRASRFTEGQIIGMLKEPEAGAKTTDVCRKHGISWAIFYKFKARCGGMDVSNAAHEGRHCDDTAIPSLRCLDPRPA